MRDGSRRSLSVADGAVLILRNEIIVKLIKLYVFEGFALQGSQIYYAAN